MPEKTTDKNQSPICHRAMPRDQAIQIKALNPDEDAQQFLGAIEGYASTDSIDWYGEIIDPQAFIAHIAEYMKFPVVLPNHQWGALPIGKVTRAEVHEHGLWVRAVISKTAVDIWQLIQEGILKAFSIGWARGKKEERPDQPPIWREIELLEISVVNIPANSDALFAEMRSRGMTFGGQEQSPIEGGAEMPDGITLDQVRETAAEAANALGPSLIEKGASAARDEAMKIVSEVKTAVANCLSKEEAQGIIDKALAPLSAALARVDRLEKASGVIPIRGMDAPLNQRYLASFVRTLAQDANVPESYVRTICLRAEDQTMDEKAQHVVRNLQRMHDETLVVYAMMQARNPHAPLDIRSLKIFKDFNQLASEFGRAMAGGNTGYGAEWLPTMLSADMVDKITAEAAVAPSFPQFAMPSKVYDWPTRSAWGSVYLTAESTSDSPSKIKASTPATSKVTFTAKMGAIRNLLSAEFTEDSIIPALPSIMDGMAKAFAHGLDDAILNGDTSATHQDSDVTDAEDWRKAWSGLRFIALAASGSKAAATSATVANIGALWKLMGLFGATPANLRLILSARDRAQLMIDSNVLTVANFGDRATLRNGDLAAVLGMPTQASAESRVNLNASGVYDGSTVTKSGAIIVDTESFKLGNRRMVTLEVDKDIETQQYVVVGTWRGDFKQMRTGSATSGYPAVIGYNMA